MVEISFVEQFPDTLPLSTLKATKALRNMMVTKKGSRLSIQPVTKTEFNIVVHLGRAANQRP
jgi:predicted RNA-binding protein with PUA-like domain